MNDLPASHPIASEPLKVESACACIHVDSIVGDYVQFTIESGLEKQRVSVQVSKTVHVHYTAAGNRRIRTLRDNLRASMQDCGSRPSLEDIEAALTRTLGEAA